MAAGSSMLATIRNAPRNARRCSRRCPRPLEALRPCHRAALHLGTARLVAGADLNQGGIECVRSGAWRAYCEPAWADGSGVHPAACRRDVARRGTQRSAAGAAAQCCACVRTFVSMLSDLRVRHCHGAGTTKSPAQGRASCCAIHGALELLPWSERSARGVPLRGQRSRIRNPCRPCRPCRHRRGRGRRRPLPSSAARPPSPRW